MPKKPKSSTGKPVGRLGRRLEALNAPAGAGTDTLVAERTCAGSHRAKFVVVDKAPEVGPQGVRYAVRLQAVFEGRSIHHGQAYVQGNADNLIFGDGPPEAEIVMKIAAKDVADTFASGKAVSVFLVVEA